MKTKLERLAPPGMDVRRELLIYLGMALLFIACFSLPYFYDLQQALDDLYAWYGYGTKVLIKGSVMESFGSLMRHKFMAFWSYVCLCLGTGAGHYQMFRQESRSIYVMKRLKDPLELHRRCWALPLLAIAFGVVLMLVLTGIYKAVYLAKVPAVCLPASDEFDFWRLFTW